MKKTITAALIAAAATAALMGAGTAQADGYGVLDAAEADYGDFYNSMICDVLDEYHSESGLYGVATVIMDDGFTAASAADIVNATVKAYCPRNWPLLVNVGNASRGQLT